MQQKKTSTTGDARGHRYSGIVIQFAMILYKKTKARKYDLFQQCFHLPDKRTLLEYTNADATSPDGLMFESIIQHASIMYKNGITSYDDF